MHTFSGQRITASSRYVVANKTTAKRLVNSLGLDELAAKGIKTTVIEGYPGPGILTRQLLLHPAVEKVIAMEDNKLHLQFLDILKADRKLGPKLTIIRKSAYSWPSYDEVLDNGHLDHLKDRIRTSTGEPAVFSTSSDNKPVSKEDPNWETDSPLLFLAQLPCSVYGDQLFAQIISGIARRRWLFRFTRMRLAFTMNKPMIGRINAVSGDTRQFTRISALVQCLADHVPTAFSAEDALEPYAEHFFPSRQPLGARLLMGGRSIPNTNVPAPSTKLGIGFVRLEPKKHVPIPPDAYEMFEFLTRQMFVARSTPVETALKAVSPGAENVLTMLNTRGRPEERIDPEQNVTSLNPTQWAGLSRMFKLWPFRPKILVEAGHSAGKTDEDPHEFF